MNSVLVEVLRNNFQAIVEDMARVMERTAYTTFVKETADFSVGFVSLSGEYVAYPWQLGATCYLGTDLTPTLERLLDVREGDIFLCNDPYLGGPLCTHLPDLQMLKPIFHDKTLVCWAYAFVHASDVGGAVPASVLPTASEIFQEGIRIRPVKLFNEGSLNEDVLNLILDNTRIPASNWGDLKAMIAAVNTCDRQVRELVQDLGCEGFLASVEAVLDHAEKLARVYFAEIPAGTYRFVDYLDDDLLSQTPVRIEVALTSRDGSVHLDFTGTDSQVASALNLASQGAVHPFLCLALTAYLVTRDQEIPKASSILRPVTVTAPPGSLLNAQFPAAVGVRYATALRVADTVLGALSRALPDLVPAAASGMIAPVVVSIRDSSGSRSVNVVEPLLGGSGGRIDADGVDGADSTTAGYLRNTPIEAVERDSNILVRSYQLAPDTGGPGAFRGGHAVQLELEALVDETVVTARALERFRFAPWGVRGGLPGTPGSSWLTSQGTRKEIGKFDVLTMAAGDVLTLVSSGAGGYGDPRTRSAELVARDVLDGLMSRDAAARHHGIETDGYDVHLLPERVPVNDDEATRTFDFGEYRRQLESTWSDDVQREVQAATADLPTALRARVKSRVFELLQQAGTSASNHHDVTDVIADVVRHLNGPRDEDASHRWKGEDPQ